MVLFVLLGPFLWRMGWSGGAMVVGKLSVPGRPTSLGKSRARAYCSCSRCGGCSDIFTLFYPFSPLSPSLWETTRYRLKYCLKGSLSPKSTDQPNFVATPDWKLVPNNIANLQAASIISTYSMVYQKGQNLGPTI